MDMDTEQALTADGTRIRHNLAARYGIPARLLVPAIDPLLLAVDDHILFPLAEEWCHRRWVRVSSLKILNRVCLSSRRVLEDKILMLHIMPYLPLEDAFVIHSFVENRGEIAGLYQLPDTGARSGGFKLPMEGRHGVLVVDDPDGPLNSAPPFLVNFFVINYGLLASKAREHERLAGLLVEANDLISKVNFHMSELLKGQTLSRVLDPQHIQKIESKARVAQEELILSTYMNGMDPHDTIADLDTDIHDKIYDESSDPCNSNAPCFEEMPHDTRARLEEYIDELQASGRNIYHPKHAECEVLAAEGLYDSEIVFARASNSLKKALDDCNEGLDGLVSDLIDADKRCSLMGVHGKRAGVIMQAQGGY